MHGSAILSTVGRPDISEDHVDGFWRNIIGYSIGEVGIHRAGFWIAVAAVLFSNLCIFLTGTLVFDWVAFWQFWDKLPIWQSSLVVTAAAGAVVWHGQRRRAVDVKAVE